MPSANDAKAGIDNFAAFLDDFARRVAAGEKPAKADISRMLEVDPESAECCLMKERAREKARKAAGNLGKVWSAVGIEHRACPMNCQFCSLGKKWGLVKEEFDWTAGDILAAARQSVASGASWFTLRTNEFYGVDRLCGLARMIRGYVPGDYGLVVNTGELTSEEGARLKSAGVTGVYHTWRLGEGEATGFRPETRLETMRSIVAAGLELYHMVEPLGPEHGNDEIADRIMAGEELGSALGGAMARINVTGTPFADSGRIGQGRLSQIIAVCRLCAGPRAVDICVVPPDRESLEAGANVITVEIGAIPRSRETEQKGAWRGFGLDEAREMLASAGYELKKLEEKAR